MKYFLFIIIVTTSFSSVAQTSKNQVTLPKYEEISQRESGQIAILLDCEKEQKDSVLMLMKDYYFNLAKIQNIKLTLAERKRMLRAIEDSTYVGLQKILTPGQYEFYVGSLLQKKLFWQTRQDSLIKARQFNNPKK